MKILKGNRTRIFGTAIAILGVLQQYTREIIPLEYQGYTLAAIGVAVIILREITSTPSGSR